MRYLKTTLVLLMVVVLAACGQAATSTPAATTETATATATATAAATEASTSSPPVLELAGMDDNSKALTMEELKALPVAEGWAGIKSSTGQITPPVKFKGVAVEDLCALVGEITPQTGVSVVAKDGYAMTFSSEQVLGGAYIAYDPATGDEITVGEKLRSIIAYEADGKPIPEQAEGPLRLVVVTSKNNQVVDGHWSVKWVEKIELKSLASEWVLKLCGVLKEDLDRGSFESCSAPNCHGATWTDDDGQVWSGNPLWLLVGAIDDDLKHGTAAFSDSLADEGYKVEVIAADGYTVSLDSSDIRRNDKIIVAHLMNSDPLDEESFPLRLVGPDLSKKEMAGQIVEIRLDSGAEVPETPTATAVETTAVETPASTAGGDGLLVISGAVENALSLTMDDLKALGVVETTAAHPKKGDQSYQGVRISALLDKAVPDPEATRVLFTASDGYSAEVTIADLGACADCLIAIGDDGKLSTVMPGMEGEFWVKDVVKIELQ